MRKILFTLLCILSTLTTFAQTSGSVQSSSANDQHLLFKGVPIDGTPQEFGRRLTSKGFAFDYEYDGSLWYTGPFAGYNNCSICVKSANNLVYEVVVLFPDEYSWNSLYNTYSSLETLLIQKYGNPYVSSSEFINTPSYIDIEDPNSKFAETKRGHCEYYVFFLNATGAITMEIKGGDVPRVGIHYIDSQNEKAKSTSAYNDL